jgi:uncharacterized protein
VTATIEARIARELDVREEQVQKTVNLIDEGATVPFIARYRKEVTGGLDDIQLRSLEERLGYLRELETRRKTVIASIVEQGKMTDALRKSIDDAETKQKLEDLYLPYKQKRRTKAMIAREAGLQPLADQLLADPNQDPKVIAAEFLAPDKEVATADAALEGARFILIEEFAEDAKLIGHVREWLGSTSRVVTKVAKGKQTDPDAQRFRDYFAHDEPLEHVPSHRALAFFRARKEGFLDAFLGFEGDTDEGHYAIGDAEQGQRLVMERFGIAEQGRPGDAWLTTTARLAWKAKISLHVETDLMGSLRERSEEQAIRVFADNLRDLLLAAPAGPKAILGFDPGLRTGCKVAIVDRTGKVLTTDTVYPHVPRNDWDGSLAKLGVLCKLHGVEVVSIGNGTGSRESDRLFAALIKAHPELGLQKLVVSEAGASVYSASERASREFPDMDVSLRGAVSIARRLQDPLAELVKIDPKAIGVGQYQHDVNQSQLARSLEATVEDCVNHVGVDLNTASEALLSRVAGLSSTLAKNIVTHRDANGPFKTRKELLKVSRLGPKAFEQAAGFLRIQDGKNPLDRSAVHPEAYPVIERILSATGKDVGSLLGDSGLLRTLKPEAFVDDTFGVPTITDILAELEKPGRDPRPEFKAAAFVEGVEAIGDLKEGMQLEGVVSNVTAFGAFVDIGVHQDGLVHISQLADRFVEDPREVVKAGQIVKVKVTAIDIPRNRIALTMKLHEAIEAGGDPRKEQSQGGDSRPQQRGQQQRGAQQRGGNQHRGGGGQGGGGQGGGGQRAPRDTGQRDFGPKEAAANPFAAQLSKLNVRNN